MIHVALYRHKAGNWLDWTINLLSGRKGYSHSELRFSDDMWFSSTSRDQFNDPKLGKTRNGCWLRKIPFHPENWLLIEWPCTPERESIMRAKAESLVAEGALYDFGAVLRFPFPHLAREHPSKYMCSEACVTVLQTDPLCPESVRRWLPYTVAPNHMLGMDVPQQFAGVA